MTRNLYIAIVVVLALFLIYLYRSHQWGSTNVIKLYLSDGTVKQLALSGDRNWSIALKPNDTIDRVYVNIPNQMSRFAIYGNPGYSEIKNPNRQALIGVQSGPEMEPIIAAGSVDQFHLDTTRDKNPTLFNQLDRYKEFTIAFNSGKL